jgi:multiple sugar transport system substrate-binding protein
MALIFFSLSIANAQEPVTVSMGTEPGIHLDSFEANEERCEGEVGVDLQINVYPGGEWTTTVLPTESAAKSGLFDMVNIPTSVISQFVAADYLVPLENFDLEAVNPDDLTLFNLSEYQGQHYLIPFVNELQGILYRSDLVNDPEEQAAFEEQYGYELAPPRSLDQYFDQLEFFNRPDENLYGSIQYGLRAIWITIAYEELLNMHGLRVVDVENDYAVDVNTPEGVQALRDLKRIYDYADPASLTSGWVEGNANFNEGRDYSIMTWNSVLLSTNDPSVNSNVAGKTGFVLIPLPDDAPENPKAYMSQWGLAITTTSQQPEEAWNLIVCLTSTESAVHGVVNTDLGNTPARYSALTDPRALERFPWMADIAEGIENLTIIDRPAFAEYYTAILGELMPEYLSRLISGELTPEETAEQLEAEIIDVLREGGYIE